MISKFEIGIVWVKVFNFEGQENVPWDVPMKVKICGEYSVWKEKGKDWAVTHNPSGLRVSFYPTKKIAESKAILFDKKMTHHWDGNTKEDYNQFLEEIRILKDLYYIG